jgi:hypothetical protein
MSALAEMTQQAVDLRAHVDVAAKRTATATASAARLGKDRSPHDAAVAARKALAEVKDALEVAQRRAQQLDNTITHLSRVLPFLEEGWAEQRALLRRAIDENAQDGLASWLNYWFAAASSRRMGALRRLQSDFALPLGERMSDAADALAGNDLPLPHKVLQAYRVLQIGADGVRVGPRQVPDRLVPADHGPGHYEPDHCVREDLRLLAARLALHYGLPDQADTMLHAGPNTAARLALRSRSARLRDDSDEGESLLGQARDLDPHDLDVTEASIVQARQRGKADSALDYARASVGAFLSLSDVGDIGRLVDPPAELWIALAERARDEGNRDRALGFFRRATVIARRDHDDEAAAAAAEQRAGMEESRAEQRKALVSAGQSRTIAGQLERARRDYEAAASIELDGAEDARVQASAALRWADVVSAIARQRPYRASAGELRQALSLLRAAQEQADVDGTESWSYLTESDLRIQLSKVPGTHGRYEHEWGALRAAAQAVSRMPAWARAWLTLADAAMTCHLYRVAEAAAEQAYEIEDNEATRASYVQALVNVGRYEDALRQLENPGDAWRQCSRGFIALRLDQAEEAIRHFAGVKIDPTWIWAWHSSICALVSIGDLASARRKSEEFMCAIADREGERSWLSAAAFDARLHGRLKDARMHARTLFKVAGPNNGRALHAMGEAQILGKDPAGWDLLARAIAQDPRPTSIDAWEREDLPVLAALAAERGFTLESLKPPPAIMHPDARPHVSDPVAELRAAAAATVLPQAAEAARLTEAALQARQRPDSQAAQARGTRNSDSRVSASDRPPLRLRLPASWFAASTDSGHEDRPRVHYLPELPELLWWAGPEVELSGSDELEPDGYQILAGDTIYASGHVDPRRRYCRRDTLSLLPEGIRTSPHIDTTDQDARIPSDLLDNGDTLAALLTRSAAEMIAEHYYEVAQKLGPAPPPIPPPPQVYQLLTTDRLAYRRWELRRRPLGDDWADWIGAERLQQQFIREAAYLLWVSRDRWPGDDWADWFAAERKLTGNETQPSPLPGSVVDECLRQQLEEEADLYRWLVFVQTVRRTAESGSPAELRVSAGDRSCPRPISPPPGP